MRDDKKKLKAAKLSILALFVLNIMLTGILVYARHQRDYMIEEFNKLIDEQVEINKGKSDLIEKCMTRLRDCKNKQEDGQVSPGQ